MFPKLQEQSRKKERSISQVKPLIMSPLNEFQNTNLTKKYSERGISKRNSFHRLPSLNDLQTQFKQIEAEEEVAITLLMKSFELNQFYLLE